MRKSYTRRKRKTKIKYFIYVCCLLGIVFICHTILTTSMRYRSDVSAEVLGYAKENRSTKYTIIFNANGGTGTMGNQTINYGDTENLSNNDFLNSGNIFFAWNTKADGTGTSYENKSSITITEPLENDTLNLYAQWGQGAVEVNGRYFDTVSKAIDANAIPTDNTETTVNVLANISDRITISDGMNVIMDLHGNTITNSEKEAVITNKQQLTVRNGTVITQITNTAAINNQSTGNIILDGVTVKMEKSGGKQAFYNDKGIAEIKGNSYLSSVSTIRATVHNVAGGTLKITSGTIVAPNYDAVVSAGAMTIGIKDGKIDKELVTIKGNGYGISASAKFNFYDGCVMGKSDSINNKNQIQEIEDGCIVVYKETTVDNQKYLCAYLSSADLVLFDPNEGIASETERKIVSGMPIGPLPTCTRMGYIFEGWFTERDGGERISEETIITGAKIFYAHWTAKQIAMLNGVIYPTIQEAISKVPNNTKTTITLISDTEEYFTLSDKKDIVLDLQNHTISNYDHTHTIISNRGTIEIINGTIESNAENAAIDNEKTGNMKISGLTVNATGTRQAIFNNGGILEITGNTHLTSTTTGTPTTTVLERATIQNLNRGTITITGGIITAINQHAISNDNSTLIIGIKGDGNIDNTAPIIIGNMYGINSTGILNIYDGVIKGIDDSIFGNITELEDNTQRKDYTEEIDEKTYKVTELEEIT